MDTGVRRWYRRLLPGLVAAWLALAGAGCAAVVAGEVVRGVVAGDTRAHLLTSYPVQVDGALGPPEPREHVDSDLLRLRDDRDAHEDAWLLWRTVAPEPWASTIRELRIVTDGTDGDLAAVVPEGEAGWVLELDPADMADRDELEHTLVHELGHVISLAPDQFVEDPGSSAGLVEAAGRCAPSPGLEEGCLAVSAYLAAFITQFWSLDDLRTADGIAASDDPETRAMEVFALDPDRFVSEYAATHPVEDFAESWAAYVLYDWEAEDPTLPWVQKAAFFDEYVTLRAARRAIWEALDIG